MNERQQIPAATYGTNLIGDFGYNSYGYPTHTKAHVSGTYRQDYLYEFNTVTGNLNWRKNHLRNLTESFTYDGLDRLLTVTGPQNLTMQYAANGNITGKSDLGTANLFIYNNSVRPYQLTGLETNANLVPQTLQQLTYTSFEQPSIITESPFQATFAYNTEGQRASMVVTQNGSTILTRYYVGSRYIKDGNGNEYTWIDGDAYTAPCVVAKTGGTTNWYYVLRDHLGNITHLVFASTNTVAGEYSFDAWGRRRNRENWSYTLTSDPDLLPARGFTAHEWLPWFNPYNMPARLSSSEGGNGRLYDPVVGRFLSPDNYVQMPDFSQNFNRYSYCLNNPLKYTDPDGEWVHIVIGAAIGGVINLATNWNNCDGFWQYAAAFGAEAGSGALTAAFGPLGALGGGALVGGTNDLISQTGKNFSGSVNWGQVGISTGIGGVAGIAGYGADQWASSNLGGVVINGFNINSQSVWAHTINGAIGGAAGGYAGGFTGGLLMSGDMSMAHQTGMQGMKFGAGIGAGTGFAGGLYSAKRDGLNPWTGKPKNSFTIGEGMITDPTKGWMGVDKIADDLGSDYYKPDSDIPMNGPFNGSTTSNGMYDNAIWIENNVKGTGAYIYDRGPVGNNSQYYNMEVGRTMNYPVMRVTPYYNRSQSIRVLIIRK